MEYLQLQSDHTKKDAKANGSEMSAPLEVKKSAASSSNTQGTPTIPTTPNRAPSKANSSDPGSRSARTARTKNLWYRFACQAYTGQNGCRITRYCTMKVATRAGSETLLRPSPSRP